MHNRSLAVVLAAAATVIGAGAAVAMPTGLLTGTSLVEKAQVVVNKSVTVVRHPRPVVRAPIVRAPVVVQKRRVIVR